jgi:glycosyltransferase involved in cell wall biosynthesis
MSVVTSWTDAKNWGPDGEFVRPKVSVVIPCRNEHPQVITTFLSVVEELEFWGYPYEIIVVSNMSDDGTPEILEDRFRHWVNEKRLKVIYFNDRPACWHARNVGVDEATGDVLVICDAHISVSVGTLHNMIQLWYRFGGLWHTASQMWGDPKGVRLNGYALKVEEKFWGTLSRAIPREILDAGKPPYTIPMAQYSLFLLGRKEFLEARGFHPSFRCYGGGEPHLAFKWWLLGKECWLWPKGLMRHAFGLKARWREVNLKHARGTPFAKGKGPTAKDDLKQGDEVLGYHRGYSWNNNQLWYNFLLCAYVIGGEKWLNQRYEKYHQQCKGVQRYIDDLKKNREEAERDGQEERKWIEDNQVIGFDELLAKEPWNDFSALQEEKIGEPVS